MKIIAKDKELYIDGKAYNELSNEEKQNLWLRCVDYMRTHYDDGACRMVAALVPCFLGQLKEGEGHSIEI
jgi:hypothetical protein